MFSKVFDVVCPLWKDKLIGCSADGAASMIDHLSGVVTRIQEVVRSNFVRVWCLLHQMDIVMQKTYRAAGCGFHKRLTSLIAFMRRQKLQIDKMQAVCPKLSSTRRSSMSRVSKFMVERLSSIMEYLDQTDVSQKIRKMPALSWWIVLAVIGELSGQVSECVERLQGRRITLQQQKPAVE